MALDAYLDIYLDSNSQLAAPPVVPEWVAGGLPQATISNSFFQKDGQYLNCSYVNLSNSIPTHAVTNMVLVSGTSTK